MAFDEADPGALEQAKRDVQRLVSELERLAKAPVESREFFAAAAALLRQALHAAAAGVWWREQTHFALAGDAGLSALFAEGDRRRRDAHDDLLAFAGSLDRPLLYAPNGGPLTEERTETTNPAPFLLVACPVRLEGALLGVVEVLLDPARRALAYAGYQRLAMKAAEECANFHRNRRYRQFAAQEGVWDRLDRFIRTLHGGLSTAQTCHVLANSGQALIGCERVSVAVKRGARARVAAVSGQDVVDRRANLVRRLAKLADEVLRYGEAYVYEGVVDAAWPRPLAKAMAAYVEEANSRLLIAVPLVDDRAGREGRRKERRAVLVAEVVADDALPAELAGKVEVVARHGALAVYNALDADRILLLPLWRALGGARERLLGSRLARTLTVLSLVVAAALALVYVPWPLRLEGKGELLPRARRFVYAPAAGLVKEVAVDFASEVVPGSDLLAIHSPALEAEAAQLRGEVEAKRGQCEALKTARADRADRGKEGAQTGAKIAELEADVLSLQGKLEILDAQLDALRLRAPIAGRVLDWEPRAKLLGKVVREGEALLEVADAAGEWVVEVRLPERAVTHVAWARGPEGRELPAALVLASAPERTYRGRLAEVATQAAPLEGENVCLARVRLDEPIPAGLLLARSEVHAKVDCGQRALGYVLFRDVIDFVREKLFF